MRLRRVLPMVLAVSMAGWAVGVIDAKTATPRFSSEETNGSASVLIEDADEVESFGLYISDHGSQVMYEVDAPGSHASEATFFLRGNARLDLEGVEDSSVLYDAEAAYPAGGFLLAFPLQVIRVSLDYGPLGTKTATIGGRPIIHPSIGTSSWETYSPTMFPACEPDLPQEYNIDDSEPSSFTGPTFLPPEECIAKYATEVSSSLMTDGDDILVSGPSGATKTERNGFQSFSVASGSLEGFPVRVSSASAAASAGRWLTAAGIAFGLAAAVATEELIAWATAPKRRRRPVTTRVHNPKYRRRVPATTGKHDWLAYVALPLIFLFGRKR